MGAIFRKFSDQSALFLHAVFLPELVDASAGVDDLLLAGEERVAL